MRIYALALTPFLVAAGPVADLVKADRCARPGADRVSDSARGSTGARPLNEMPDARPVLSVYREVGGCPVLLVREGGRIIEEPVGRPEQRRVFRP